MRIALVGNSHAAMMKGGWDMIAGAFPEIGMTFFASPKGSLDGLVVDGGRLVARDEALAQRLALTSGGRVGIDPVDFDIFVLVGLDLAVRRIDPRLSGALRKVTAERALDCLSMKIARQLRALCDKPILCLPTPRRAADGGQTDRDTEATVARYRAGTEALTAVLPVQRIRVLGQPVETLVSSGQTAMHWSRGARKMPRGDGTQDAFGDDDTRHMNADFGALWLRQVLPVAM